MTYVSAHPSVPAYMDEFAQIHIGCVSVMPYLRHCIRGGRRHIARAARLAVALTGRCCAGNLCGHTHEISHVHVPWVCIVDAYWVKDGSHTTHRTSLDSLGISDSRPVNMPRIDPPVSRRDGNEGTRARDGEKDHGGEAAKGQETEERAHAVVCRHQCGCTSQGVHVNV